MRASSGAKQERHWRNGRSWALCLGALVFLWGICWLPYRIPGARVYSESYAFGYNNRVAAALTACGAVLLALFGPELSLCFAPGKALTRSTLRKALAISGAIAAGLYGLTRRLDGAAESIYLIDRIKLLMEGHRPYRDFEYAYGASFLYVPAWMSRAFHLPVGDAYGLFWLGLVLLGTGLFYQTVLWVEMPGSAKRSVFLLFWAFSLPNLFSFGITYTLFRYVLPCFLGLVAYRRLGAPGRAPVHPVTLLWPVPMYALLLVVSQELAISFAVGVLAFLLRFGRLRTTANLVAFVASVTGMGALTYAVARCGVFRTLRTFGSGGFNLTVRPAPYVLLFFLLVALAACYAGQHVRRGQPSALLMLIAVSACSLAAALGRCDPLHVLPNPLGVTLAGSFLLLGLPPLRRYLWPAMWVVFPVLYSLTVGLESGPQIAKTVLPELFVLTPARLGPRVDRFVMSRMTRALGAADAEEKFKAIKAAALSDSAYDLPALFHQAPGTVFEAPFGFAPGRFGTFHSPAIDEGYFFENENLLTPEAVDRKVEEMHDHPERPLILLPGRENACVLRYAAPRFAIAPPFYYPYMVRPVHELDVTEPMCAYIRRNYQPAAVNTGETFGYVLWVPR